MDKLIANRPRPRGTRVAAISLLVATVATGAPAGGPYVLRTAAIDASGATAAGSGYVLAVAQGQSQASLSQGGSFRLSVGVIPPSAAPSLPPDPIFRHGFETP